MPLSTSQNYPKFCSTFLVRITQHYLCLKKQGFYIYLPLLIHLHVCDCRIIVGSHFPQILVANLIDTHSLTFFGILPLNYIWLSQVVFTNQRLTFIFLFRPIPGHLEGDPRGLQEGVYDAVKVGYFYTFNTKLSKNSKLFTKSVYALSCMQPVLQLCEISCRRFSF